MRPPIGSSTIAYFSAVREVNMESDFPKMLGNYFLCLFQA